LVRVLITGAYGLIGNLLVGHLSQLAQDYEVFGMVRRRDPSARAAGMSVTTIPESHLRIADLTDHDAVRAAVEGMDIVVHLAANPEAHSNWKDVLSSNIVGTHTVFEACREAGVGRVVFASTNMVVAGYRTEPEYSALFQANPSETELTDFRPVRHDWPVRPTSYYSCSKVFGEALAHMYSTVHGMSCICLRIGWVVANDNPPIPVLWCSHRDVVQLLERCMNAPESVRYDIFFGQSANSPNFVDIQHARDVLGYEPQDGAVREPAD
jgi:nucleoside-diphosphate-sugar epimerase